jgi:hypothetical protein
VEEASMRAWRLVPEPEMRTVSFVGGRGADMLAVAFQGCGLFVSQQ